MIEIIADMTEQQLLLYIRTTKRQLQYLETKEPYRRQELAQVRAEYFALQAERRKRERIASAIKSQRRAATAAANANDMRVRHPWCVLSITVDASIAATEYHIARVNMGITDNDQAYA